MTTGAFPSLSITEAHGGIVSVCMSPSARSLGRLALALILFGGQLMPAGAQQQMPPPREAAQAISNTMPAPSSNTTPVTTPARDSSIYRPKNQSAHISGLAAVASSNAASIAWRPLGPSAVSTPAFGLVSGRVSAIAFDPADPTGNRVYVGTTGGGVWLSQNAATSNTGDVQFAPLTDVVGALTTAHAASISIGALSVQPGGTGVVLAGTGDPNDEMDSYYGAGILRSTDGGNSWSLIQSTVFPRYLFSGEAFAGFAWSTVNPQLVVTAVSQALDGLLANAIEPNASYEGLFYSTDSGATWNLATIRDSWVGSDMQGPNMVFAQPDGNAATSVVWNPVRKLFIAAVRAHGYYQSIDGVTWTRLSSQPGTGFTQANCPTFPGSAGSPLCPIFRGTLAVNQVTGDTFAWTVDRNLQDKGLWQDQCALSAGVCANQNITFGKRLDTTALETNDAAWGPVTIEDGDWTLALAAIPSAQDTVLLAGTWDVWKCSLAGGCTWRNTTNAATCRSAQVAQYQHALAWSATNPQELLIGNDGGLWRSLDGVGETGAACAAGDATHFQNLNSGLSGLAEVRSLTVAGDTPEMTMAGFGVNGVAGVKSAPTAAGQWPQILGGYGGPVVIDPADKTKWYVNNQAGVSIHRCAQSDVCTPQDFATSVVTNADVGGDVTTMPVPAPFLIDPLDASQLLVGTCRVWRGPASGSGWSSANSISPLLDGQHKTACNGDPVILSMAAMALADGSEVIYAGMPGPLEGGGSLAGHVFRTIYNPASPGTPTWKDLSSNPVTNTTVGMNAYGFDVSELVIDSHDPTGNTVYVVVRGIQQTTAAVRTLYRSTDGGAHWTSMISNLRPLPANALVVDPQDANTVYIALDVGVYSTRQIANCFDILNACWSAYGTGLPQSPVMQLAVAGDTLVAGTYGRGLWQIPLWTAGTQATTAVASPRSLTFPMEGYDTTSAAQTVTVTNQGPGSLIIASIDSSGDFAETDNCQGSVIAAGSTCAVQVTFTPAEQGARTGQLSMSANVAGGELSVDLSGTGGAASAVTLTPPAINFGQVAVGATSDAQQVTVENTTASAVPVISLGVNGAFAIATNACGDSLAAHSDCQIQIKFSPILAGAASGMLTLFDAIGTQTVSLSGTAAARPTDTLSGDSLTFPETVVGQLSAPQPISIANTGGLPLTGIATTVTGPYRVTANCSTQLSANATCTFSVVFQPTATGAQAGSLTISDALRTQTVSLSGTGEAPAQISVDPAALNFAGQAVGATSAPQAFTVRNAGAAPMASIGFQIAGTSASSFRTGGTSCGAVLDSGSTCTVQLIFAPVIAGGSSAFLTISSSTLGVKAVQAALSGTAQVTNGLNVTPGQMTLTAGTIMQASPAQTLTVANSSSIAAAGLALGVPAPFSLAQNNCEAQLPAGASCTAGVVFTPTANGAVPGLLTVTSTNLNPAEVILNGIGGAAGAVQLQPGLLNFGTVGVGAASPAQTITFTNVGPINLAGFTLQISSGFRLATTTCPTNLEMGASCSADLVFAPTVAGQQSGGLTVASSALAVPVQAALSGTGFDFSASISGSLSQTVSNGQTALYTLVLTPANGVSGTFTFACDSLPAIATCSFNPPTETVAANTTGNVRIQIATGHTASSIRPRGWVPALCTIALLPFVLWRRRKVLLQLFVLGLVMVSIASCAGSGGGSGQTASSGTGNSNAPAGTYSIPIRINAEGVSHSVTVTLTVD